MSFKAFFKNGWVVLGWPVFEGNAIVRLFFRHGKQYNYYSLLIPTIKYLMILYFISYMLELPYSGTVWWEEYLANLLFSSIWQKTV